MLVDFFDIFRNFGGLWKKKLQLDFSQTYCDGYTRIEEIISFDMTNAVDMMVDKFLKISRNAFL